MPQQGLYLAGFGVYTGMEIGGYKISNLNCGHETISRYHKYEYPCEITFKKSQQTATPEVLLKQFSDYVSGVKYIDSEYGNPYRCEFGTPKITRQDGDTVVIQSRGKSTRVSRSEVPSVSKPIPPSLLLPSFGSSTSSSPSVTAMSFPVFETDPLRSSMVRSPSRLLIPSFATSSSQLSIGDFKSSQYRPASSKKTENEIQYNMFPVRPISPSKKIDPISFVSYNTSSILDARARTPPKIEAVPFELTTSDRKPTVFSLLYQLN